MIALSTALARLVSPFPTESGIANTYIVQPATLTERAVLEGQIAAGGGAEVWPHERFDAITAGIRATCPDDGRERMLLLADMAREGVLTDPKEQEIWRGLVESMDQSWPGCAALRLRAEVRTQIAPVLAVRMFLRGREPEPLALGVDGRATEAALWTIPPIELRWLGVKLFNDLYPEQHRGNSEPPSKSADAPVTSTGDAMAPAAKAGKLTGGAGRRTRR